MKTPTLIIGGGLSGLYLAYLLQQAGHDFELVEARNRFGGRIKSLHVAGGAFDLGPSWIWQGQNRIASLLQDLGLRTFEQWSAGRQLYEQPDGTVVANTGFMSMAGSMRICGGTSALTDALVSRLDPARLHAGHAVTTVAQGAFATLADGRTITAERIVIATPPRVAAQTGFVPALPDPAVSNLRAIPTWMGAHAKFVAVYETPFWRADGLSGDASSRRGPLAEIHDASPDMGGLGALFGFVGLPADLRKQAAAELEAAALAQLTHLFGSKASAPLAIQMQDWSQARYTATQADASPPPGHPPYRMPPALRDVWNGQLVFAVTEMAPDNGGLIEGALAAAEAAAATILTG